MITVDADEVTPNTEYTCNITGRIPAFTGVQLGELSVHNQGANLCGGVGVGCGCGHWWYFDMLTAGLQPAHSSLLAMRQDFQHWKPGTDCMQVLQGLQSWSMQSPSTS